MADAQLPHWLRLTLIPGVGGETRRQLLSSFGLPEAVFSASGSTLRAIIGATLAERLLVHDCEAAVAAALKWASQSGNRIITLADDEYPRALLASADPPVLLYVKGDPALLNRPAVAVVGSRNATRQGEANAQAFAAALSDAGLTVVSGLALGIDAAAHRGALTARGSTIAVIGTGADRIYPAANEPLAREIAAHGTIISEFPMGTPAMAANFPRRNRLIAGLCRGCLVVEAAERSGSLITARLAAENGRDVFAIPGSIHSAQSKGCHKLIRQGAKLVETAQDILEDLRWEAIVAPFADAAPADRPLPHRTSARTIPATTVTEAQAGVLAALGHDPTDLDTLTERTGLTAAQLLAMLLPLELDGRVDQLPGGRYQRIS